MTSRALCITGDAALRRTLRRTLQASGSTVEIAEAGQALEKMREAPFDLIVVDRASRQQLDLPRLVEAAKTAKIVVLGESLAEDEIVGLLRGDSVDHVIEENPDEKDLVVTSVKLLRNDIFGLEKYLSWGVMVHERTVADYDEKRVALQDLADYAREVGARRQIVSRIETVGDELLMNAMYDAPAVRKGIRPRIAHVHGGNGKPVEEVALLRYACDGRYFAISVRDNYGELRKEAILDNVLRARSEKGTPRIAEVDGGGAGLGLYFVLSSVTRFIVNVQPGKLTEVIGLFDLKVAGRDQDSCARSMHIFTTAAGSSPQGL